LPMNDEYAKVNFQRGVTLLVLLSLLKREDMYGYQLVQSFEALSGGLLRTQEGSLYPVLYKLLDKGYITDKRVLSGKRMVRIYYHLEPSGMQYLQELERDYRTITAGVMKILDGGESSDEQR